MDNCLIINKLKSFSNTCVKVVDTLRDMVAMLQPLEGGNVGDMLLKYKTELKDNTTGQEDT